MKRIITIFCAVAVLCSCVREELEPVVSSVKKLNVLFEGQFSTSTKVQYNDAVDGVHALTWSSGDAIGIFSYDQTETQNNNIKAELHENTVGATKGVFVPIDEVYEIPPVEEGGEPTEGIISIQYPQSSDETFVVYYPYRKGTEISVEDGCLHSSVPASQVQDRLGDRKVCANGFATAVAAVQAGEGKATFALTHKLAYIAVKATSSEFTGYQFHGVHLFDMSGNAALAGNFSINPIDGTLKVDNTSVKSTVRVDVKNHDFTSAPQDNEVYLAVLPGDFSTADMYMSVVFINEKGATKTIPMKFDKTCVFPAGSLTRIDMGEITSAMNVYPWYETDEERQLLGFWAYGPQNTYMVERPDHKLPNPETPDYNKAANLFTIGVKPRGDFSKVKEPKYFSVLASSEYGDPAVNMYVRRFLSVDGTKEGSFTNSQGTPNYIPVNSDYTISCYVLNQWHGTGRWGILAIYDQEYNLLWTYMINGYREGDAPTDVHYPGFTMMDRFLGQGVGNKKAEEIGEFDTGCISYFQWGRKDPFPWSIDTGRAFSFWHGTEPFASIEESFTKPTTKVNAGSNKAWYSGEVRYDLWGGYNNTEEWYDPDAVGMKTIFDPCPEGYRVPDARVFKEVGDKALRWEYKNGHKLQETNSQSENYHIKTDGPFSKPVSSSIQKNHSVLAYELSEGEYDYWPWFGYKGVDPVNWNGYGATENYYTSIKAWANSAWEYDISRGRPRAVSLEYAYFSNSMEMNTRHDSAMNGAFPVRCQKEE